MCSRQDTARRQTCSGRHAREGPSSHGYQMKKEMHTFLFLGPCVCMGKYETLPSRQ